MTPMKLCGGKVDAERHCVSVVRQDNLVCIWQSFPCHEISTVLWAGGCPGFGWVRVSFLCFCAAAVFWISYEKREGT